MNKGQATIFVIVAILLVAVMALFFIIFRGNASVSIGGEEFNPSSYVESCVRLEARDLVHEILPQGGFVNPGDSFEFREYEVEYLCKNVNYYEPCVNQHPLLISEIREELETGLENGVRGCVSDVEDEMQSRNYVYGGDIEDIRVDLKPGEVGVVLSGNLHYSKGGGSVNLDEIEVNVRSSVYDLALIANEIARQEAQYCYFESLGYSLLYHDFQVSVEKFSDGTKVYVIKDKESDEEMNVAIRGCAIPAGI